MSHLLSIQYLYITFYSNIYDNGRHLSLAGVNYSLWAVEIVSLLANKITSLFTKVRRIGNVEQGGIHNDESLSQRRAI